MTIRPTQQATFAQLQKSLSSNFARLIRAQEQISSGKRILNPSDDPVGASLSLSYRRQIATAERYRTAVDGARVMLDSGASKLQDATNLVSEARSALLTAMNGTLSDEDRRSLGASVKLIRDSMLEIANARSGNRYLFGGAATTSAPFETRGTSSGESVRYAGASQAQDVLVGLEARLGVTLPGDEVFASIARSGARFAGLTGARLGSSANQGVGYARLHVRHDSTAAIGLGAGIALAFGGANDTILGAHGLVVDPATNTARLGAGPAITLPAPTDPAAQSVRLANEHGAEVHLDFSGWTGVAASATLVGSGSASLDGSSFTPLTLSETDLQLRADGGATVLHVDATGLHRAGVELVTFGGTVNVFDALQGLIDDLENRDGLTASQLNQRFELWLSELDRNNEALLTATTQLGSLSARAQSLGASFEAEQLDVRSRLSGLEDVDFSQAVLEMSRAEQTLQLAQATSSRLLQSSLLNFLR